MTQPFGELHDSGDRMEFETGMVRDTAAGKARFDLTIPEGLPFEETIWYRLAAHMAKGAEKYSARNWERANTPEELARFRESLFRHFMEYYCGVDDGEDKVAGILFNIEGIELIRYRQRQQRLEDDWEEDWDDDDSGSWDD